MATVEIKQGDSYAIFVNLAQDGKVLTPSMVDDLEVSVGEALRFCYLDGSLHFDTQTNHWYIWPTQEQTFSMEEGSYKVEVRAKYKNQEESDVRGYDLEDRIKVRRSASREVL